MPRSARRLALEAQSLFAKADKEGRDLSPEERAHVEQLLTDAEAQGRTERQIKALGRDVAGPLFDRIDGGEPRGGGPGDAFVRSQGYKQIADSSTRGSAWSSGPVEIPLRTLRTKTTLVQGDADTPAAGAPLAPPDTRPGVQSILFEPVTVAVLLGSATTTTNVVRTIVETLADPGAISTVAEGADKPEAALDFEEVDVPVRKIASFLPVSDEMLEDALALQAYLNGRLSLFVQQEEENQILNGDDVGTHLNGLLNQVPGANQDLTSDATSPNAMDHIHAALMAAQESFLPADGIVVNTADWGEIRLLKDSTQNYLGGSPFANGPAQPGESLFGRRVVVTSAISPGTALVGAFGTGATLFRRGGLTVEASNSHSDYFRKNLTAIRAEERVALAVHRAESFATAATGLS